MFAFPPEVEFEHYARLPLDAVARGALLNAIDAFAAICAAHAVSPETLRPLADAARSPSMAVRGFGITRLSVLCHYFPEATPLVDALCVDDDEEVRLFMTATLANLPEALALPRVGRALSDASWRVRKAAAQVGTVTAWASLLGPLEAALAREPDARVRVVLQLAIDHLDALADAPTEG